MESELKSRLQVAGINITGLTSLGGHYKCTNEDQHEYFVKVLTGPGAVDLISYEQIALEALHKNAVGLQIVVPKTYTVGTLEGGSSAFLAMDFLQLSNLSNKSQRKLGRELASLHMANWKFLCDDDKNAGVHQFGFPTPTPCGLFLQPNDWKDSWIDFLIDCRLQPQMNLISDSTAQKLWRSLLPLVPQLFEGIPVIQPSLIHGDLWAGNVSEGPNGELFIYDPACSYSHHEFELAIMVMFGGFTSDFFQAYYELIPKQPGHDMRLELYQLYHYLNHWNIFGDGYRGSCIRILQRLLHHLNNSNKL